MTPKKVTVEAVQGQLAVGRQEDDGPVVLLDRPADRPGGRGLGFNGGHLMMLGLGACFKSVLLIAAEERGVEVRSLHITVTASEADGPFRYDALDMAVELDADASPDELERLLVVAERGCQVSNTLRTGATVRAALAAPAAS
jgi:putative redox protein